MNVLLSFLLLFSSQQECNIRKHHLNIAKNGILDEVKDFKLTNEVIFRNNIKRENADAVLGIRKIIFVKLILF